MFVPCKFCLHGFDRTDLSEFYISQGRFVVEEVPAATADDVAEVEVKE